LFGDSRQVYVLAMTLLFLVPYALALGGLAMRLFGDGSRRILWPAVVTFLFMPAAWHALLVGYPDPVAALMVALALWAYAVAPGFVAPALSGDDLGALYADYEVPPLAGARHYAGQYGYAFALLAGLGWVTAMLRFRDRPAVRFVALFGVLELVNWVFRVRQIS